MICTENVSRGTGVRDPFAFGGYSIRLSQTQGADILRQHYLVLIPVGIKGKYGAIEIQSGGIVPVVQHTMTMRGQMPLSYHPEYQQQPPWSLPASKM